MSLRLPRRSAVVRVATTSVLAALLVLWCLAGPASAHAYLERTNPADGAVLDRAPDRLALYFSEHVVLDATRIDLVDSHGRVLVLDGLALASDEPDDTEVPSVVTADLPDLPRGAYQVRWSTLSSDDLHRTAGFFVFGVGTAVTAAGFDEPTPSVAESGLRWLVLLGLAAALGSALVSRVAGSGGPPDPTGRRLRWWGSAGAAAAALVAVVLLVDQVLAAGLSLGGLVTSGYGPRWLVRETGLLVLLVALQTPPGTRRRALTVTLGAVLAAVGDAFLGHAGSDVGPAYTRVAVTAVHVIAVLSWAGGVLCLAVAVLPRIRSGSGPPVRTVLRRFGGPAAALLGVGVVTGVYLSSSTVSTVDAALATTYGRILLLKITLVALMALLALVNHRVVHGRHDLDLPRRGVRVEAGLAVLVMAATAVLVSAQPATEPEFQRQPQATAGPLSARVSDLQVSLDVTPGVAGPNVVSVDVFDTRRPAPGQVTEVRVATPDGQSRAARSLGDGRWSVAGVDLAAGAQGLLVTVTRPGLPSTSVPTDWTIGDGGTARPTVVSVAPLEGLLRGLALALSLVVVVGLAVRSGRRRRQVPAGQEQQVADARRDRTSV